MTGIAGLAYGAFDFQPEEKRLGSRKDGTNSLSAEARLLSKFQGRIPRALSPPFLGQVRHTREAR